jgi:hypothetical protein
MAEIQPKHHWHAAQRQMSGKYAYWCDFCDEWAEVGDQGALETPCSMKSLHVDLRARLTNQGEK